VHLGRDFEQIKEHLEYLESDLNFGNIEDSSFSFKLEDEYRLRIVASEPLLVGQ